MKTESNKNAEQLVPFLDSQIQTLFGITPDIIPSVSTLDDKNRSRWIQSSVEKDTSKLVEVLEQTEPRFCCTRQRYSNVDLLLPSKASGSDRV